jgi:hypothetical protein
VSIVCCLSCLVVNILTALRDSRRYVNSEIVCSVYSGPGTAICLAVFIAIIIHVV